MKTQHKHITTLRSILITLVFDHFPPAIRKCRRQQNLSWGLILYLFNPAAFKWATTNHQPTEQNGRRNALAIVCA